ncbi:cytochrome c/FTR1 family iron permease [Comamonas testosteroni]|uniref:cytochrome c/FTR1 family iron permease n=1 Tax=Comamonas testosteroni TaxID=285 RepID=UPI00265FF483|nr:cytochrome c/FTR1 family iron permease [Comamonas testosteroni]WKL15834.1 cytochrome c/FTR1 family iron permease [Comamonas testosteroni]
MKMLSLYARRFLAIAALFVLWSASPAWAADPAASDQAKQTWQLLDYLAVDYGGAVSNGQIQSASEYEEMKEFAATAVLQLAALPSTAVLPELQRQAKVLVDLIAAKADAKAVADSANSLAAALVKAYPFPLSPTQPPDLARAKVLFEAKCASCHGATGAGDGPLSTKLDPPPIAFTDHDRARSRSVLALYQVISQGVTGTSMQGFGTLADEDRWALAFFTGTLSHDDAMRARGEQSWVRDTAAKTVFPDLAAAATLTEAALSELIAPDAARDLTAYVRSHPEVTAVASGSGGLTLARSLLQKSLAAARAGDRASATRLGLSAYLDGFEPLEPALRARNQALLTEVENAMLAYRGALAGGRLEQADATAQKLDDLFAQVDAELGANKADPLTTFIASLTILLREGVEALLIVVGMLAFLKKAERRDVLGYVHGGWVTALACGGLTWAVATYFMSISGASREVTEGVSSLFAAVVLLSVGLWMHQKSAAGKWQAYLKDKLSAAMTRRSAWALFALSFIAVYREVFETVLFYSALTSDGNNSALLGGLVCGVAILAVIAWLMLRSSARMPIGKFFSLSSILVAVLAVVLAGKGVAGLQEAGWLSASPIHWPRIEVLGIYPSAETAIAQALVLAIALAGFAMNAVKARNPRIV